MEERKRHKYEVTWTGGSWSLCTGTWLMRRDGIEIPSELIGLNDTASGMAENAGTRGTYLMWLSDIDTEEYEDGLDCEQWCDENAEWLERVEPDRDSWPDIYDAFSAQDWRPHSCGGCI